MTRPILGPTPVGMLLLTIVSIASAQSVDPRPGGRIRGVVLDETSRSPVSSAEVVVVGTGSHATTDQEGRFTLDGLVPATYALEITRVGYRRLVRENVQVGPGEVRVVSIEIERIINLLEEVTVTPGAFSFIEGVSTTQQTMSREEIESAPQLGEDIFRAVNRLPGLSSGDYSAHFSIRGGRHDETLILLDGLELYEPYHLKDFNEGAISIVDAETIDGVELMTGGFPAHYGNKRSGVFKIASRTPEPDRAHYSAGLSFMNARVMGRGPLWDGKGSWLVSARSGYMDLVFTLINQADLPSPRYHDVFGKLQRTLNSSNVLTIDVLHARDTYKFDAAATTGFQDRLRTRETATNTYGNSYFWTTLNSSIGSRTTVRTLLSAGLVTRSRDGAEQYVDIDRPLYSLTNDRDYSILEAKQDWTLQATSSFILSWGIDARRLYNKDSFRNVVGPNPDDPSPDSVGLYPITTMTELEKTGSRVAAYISSKWRVVDPVVVEVGGRYDRASYTGDRDFSPRTGAAVDFGEGRTLRVSWGRYRQIQGIDEVAALHDDDTFYPSELSEQWTAGLEQRSGDNSLLRVEAYLKKGSNLRPVYRNWKNAPDTFPETNEDRILVFPEKSRSRGIELYYQRDVGRRLAVRASYGLAVAEEQVSQIDNVNSADPLTFDRKHPWPQDQRHAANVDVTYRGPGSWTLSGSVAFHSGWPATLEGLVPVVDEDGAPDSAVRPLKVYGDRLPAYFRFDVRATKRWDKWRMFVEVVNLTNHDNVFGYDYVRLPAPAGGIRLTRDIETWFTILPSIGVAFSF